MKSLYSGVAGMKTHNQRMDVIGNNISNVNTTAFKGSTVTFKDVYYQTKSNASSGDATSGGTNPTQIGYGARLGTVNQVMSQSGFNYTDNVYDCAIEGEGFFQVIDEAGNIYYTRNGVFSVDSYGNLCDPSGNIVLGVSGDPSNVETGQSQRIRLTVPAVDNNVASATKTVNGYDVTISASTYGEEGNLSFTIVDSDVAYATKSGNNLTIYMDLEQEFGAEEYAQIMEDIANGADLSDETVQEDIQNAFNAAVAQFQEALNDAIEKGGLGLEEGVLPLKVEFGAMPAYNEVLAKNASNTLTLSYTDNTNATNPTENIIDINFTADVAGEFGNKYEIDMKTVSGQTSVTAKWKGDVLTIIVPETGVNVEDIQKAIDEAAGGEASKNLTVTVSEVTITRDADGTVTRDTTELGETADIDFNFYDALGSRTERIGLDGGADNFFADMATALSTVTMTDGRTAAEQTVADLETVMIDDDGVIYGRHAVHGLLLLGRIDIATFVNPMGLDQIGTSLWRESLASGEAQIKIPGSDGAGNVVSNALEMSNVDLAQEFSDMIITQRGYQANSRVITVSDTMLEELVNLKR